MILALGRRVVFGAMGFFALLGFVSVPLGDKTGWGHLQSILASPAATHAIAEFRQSAEQSQHKLFDWLTSRLRPGNTPEPIAAAPASDGSAPHKTKMQGHKGAGPVPKVPSF